MRRIISIFFISLLSIVVLAQENIHAKRDSLRNVIKTSDLDQSLLNTYQKLAMTYYRFSNDDVMRDSLFSIYDKLDVEAQKLGALRTRSIIMYNRLTVFENRREYDKVIEYAPEVLDFIAESKIWNVYFLTYKSYVESYLRLGNFNEALKKVQEMYSDAEKQGDKVSMGIALYTMSKIYSGQRRFTEHEECLWKSIELLETDDVTLNTQAEVWHHICQSLLNGKRYDETFEAGKKMEDVINRYQEYVGQPQYISWTNLWNMYARLYFKLGEYDEAEKYCDKIDDVTTTPRIKLSTLRRRARIYNARGEYDKALETVNQAMEYVDNPFTGTANSLLGLKVEILSKMGRCEEAYQLFVDAANVNDSLRNIEFANQIDDLNIQYEVSSHIAEKERQRIIIYWIVSISILLLLGLLIVFMFYLQKQRAYKSLVLKNLQWAGVDNIKDLEKCDKEQTDDEIIDDSRIELYADKKYIDDTDIVILESINAMMEKDKLFTDPELTLETFSLNLGINRRHISGAINKCTNKNFKTYINEYRIKEAIRIMSEPRYENLTIDAIAYNAGFNDRKIFYRVFKQHTGLAPSEFRNNIDWN